MTVRGISAAEGETPRRGRGIKLALAAGCVLAFLAGGCNPGDPEDLLGGLVASTGTAQFMPAEDPSCMRADLLSLQPAQSSGPTLSVNLVLTDCDASLTVSGVSFELDFDPSQVSFIGCSPGSLFNPSNLAPGTPVCAQPSAGKILGSIALATPVGVAVPAPGTASVVRLSFSVQKGANAPITFVGPDSLSNSSVFLINTSGGNIIVYTLGASGYAGGTFKSN